MGYLVDTNVFSETLRRRPDAGVVKWLAEHESEIWVSAITIAEIRRGIEKLPQGERRDQLSDWLSTIGRRMGSTILSFNRSVAHVWGQMSARLDAKGHRPPAFDGQIAATAIRHNLTVVTRNSKDFNSMPVPVLNPFDQTNQDRPQ